MDAIRTAILGFAHGHVGGYCGHWREHPELGVTVTAGWDHDSARAAENCARHGIEALPSVEAVLRRGDIRAVVIAAETSRHADLVEQAAAAGKAIILQKPIALTLSEADRIVSAVARARVPFTMAWQMRTDRHNLQAKELLAGGKFGCVFMLRRRHCLATQNMADFEKSWHVQPELNRDIFADDAAHAVDFVMWMLGKPVSVTAELGTLLNPRVPNDSAIAVFRYRDGMFAEVSCSFVALGGENTTEIACENGTIIGNYGDVPSMSLRQAGAPQLKWHLRGDKQWTASELPEYSSHWERITGLAAPLAEFLHGRRPPIATAEEGRQVLGMIIACYDSARQGKRIVLE